MSPDRRPNFPGLEFAAAEARRRRLAEEAAVHATAPVAHGEEHGGHGGGHDEHEVDPHDLASGHLTASAFPTLLDEMADLYNQIGVGKFVYLKDSWPARVVPGQSKVAHSSPLDVLPEISYLSANWDFKSSRKIELDLPLGRFSGRFGRFSKHISKTFKSVDFQGLYVLADQVGTIRVVGAGIQILTRRQWEGNTDVQASALNRAFEQPMKVFRRD